jgi:6-phosphogluconolactonase (cycloisomerase 2 family)
MNKIMELEYPMRYLCATCLLFLAVGASAQKRFVYVNTQTQPNTINAFEINTDGSLTPLASSPFSTGGVGAEGPIESMAIVHTTSGSILYAANGGDPSVSAFTINPGTGNITPINGSPFLLNDSTGTYDLAASPNHRFLFVTNEAGTAIHVFAIAASNGGLNEIAGSPFPASANISGLFVTANGKFLLAAGQTNDAVEVFTIAADGALAQIPGSPFAANNSVSDVRSNCAGNRVFTADNGSDLIDAYTMSFTGALTPVPGSPFYNGATGGGPNSFDLALSPNGKFLFTTDSFSTGVTPFAVAANGALTPVPGSPFLTNSWLGGTAITAKGDFLYSIDFASGNVVGNAIHPDGTLTAIPGSPFGPGANSLGGEVNSVITFPPPVCPTVASTP